MPYLVTLSSFLVVYANVPKDSGLEQLQENWYTG